jgi:hypothetical protein
VLGTLPTHICATDVPGRESFLLRKRDGLKRFIDLLYPLCDVFQLSKKTLHIFADQTGPLIAFNRSGSLFMNFRYYEAWRMFLRAFFEYSI